MRKSWRDVIYQLITVIGLMYVAYIGNKNNSKIVENHQENLDAFGNTQRVVDQAAKTAANTNKTVQTIQADQKKTATTVQAIEAAVMEQ